jgi:hypothetical protein
VENRERCGWAARLALRSPRVTRMTTRRKLLSLLAGLPLVSKAATLSQAPQLPKWASAPGVFRGEWSQVWKLGMRSTVYPGARVRVSFDGTTWVCYVVVRTEELPDGLFRAFYVCGGLSTGRS